MGKLMLNRLSQETASTVATLDDLAQLANYSLMDTLNCDPDAKANGADHAPRQVFTGHYVSVNPTPIKDPEYVAHSKNFFRELGFSDNMAQLDDFVRMFSGDISHVPEPMRKIGWACGYALSIYGTNTTNSARSKPATDTGTVAQFLCLRPSSTVNAGKCN